MKKILSELPKLALSIGYRSANSPMSLPQPAPDIASAPNKRPLSPVNRSRARRPFHTVRLESRSWEIAGRLTVNVALSAIALGALTRLAPYYSFQRQALQTVETSVETTEQQLRVLRSDFNRYFDPAQTNQIMQENFVGDPGQHVPVVWVDPLASPPSEND